MDLSQTFSDFSPDDRELVDQTLRFVAERSWRLGEEGFFQDLVLFLGRTLGIRHAFCDMIDTSDPSMVRTVARFENGSIVQNVAYRLKGTPCENVVGQTVCCYANGVKAMFPEDKMLVEMKAESYAGIPLWSTDGNPLGLIALIDDRPLANPELVQTLLRVVAARAGAELERLAVVEQLRFSESRFGDFARISSDWFWETDPHLRFSYFSDRFEDVTGVPPQDLLGRTRAETGAPGASRQSLEKLVGDMEHHLPFRDFEHLRVKPTGEVVYLSISGTPAFDTDGRFIGYRGIGRDITRQKEIQSELIESRNAAETANRVKSEFLASMSHELRTPLNAVLGFAQMLQMDNRNPLTADQLSHLDAIIRGGNHLLGLVNDILDLAKIEANQISLVYEDVVVTEIVAECLRLLDSTAESRGITLVNDVAVDCPLQVRADRRRISQALLNLVSNGIRYNVQGGTVTISAVVRDAGNVRIKVADTGIGIAEQDHHGVFQMFNRLSDGPMLSSEGAGIGLTVTKLLVERMDGRIGFESEKGTGSVFWIELPVPAETDA